MLMHLLTLNLLFSHKHVAMETTAALCSHCYTAKDKGVVDYEAYLCSSLPPHTQNDFTMKRMLIIHKNRH